MKAQTKFGESLNKMKEWQERHAEATNMDRVIVLTFLTAAEKRAAAQAIFGDESVVYVDGTQCTVKLTPGARFA